MFHQPRSVILQLKIPERRWIKGHDDDWSPCHPAKFAQSTLEVSPLVNGDRGQGAVKAVGDARKLNTFAGRKVNTAVESSPALRRR